MGFREKVALVCFAVLTFQTACIFSMPPIWSKKDSTKIFRKNNIKTDNNLFNAESVLQSIKTKPQTILKSFDFPEVEYSPARLSEPIRPETILEESPINVKDHSEFLNNFRKEKRRKRKYGRLKMPDEKPIGRMNYNKQNFMSQIEAFPQMEYPLTASEIWAPSFGNQRSFPLYDPYFEFDRNIYKPEKSQKLIESNSIKKGKYATTTNTKSKINNKIHLTPKNNNTVPISKKLDVLQANDQTFAKMIMPNTTTMSKVENDKSEDTSDNVLKTSKPRRKPKTRKIKIVTKSSNVLRDLIAKKSNVSCSVHNNNKTNNCSHKNFNETTNHAIVDVINDRKNTEISDLLSDDFDVCFVNHNLDKPTNDDSQICVSFDHNKSTEELLTVSNIVKLSNNDGVDEILNHTITMKNNCSVAEPDNFVKLSKSYDTDEILNHTITIKNNCSIAEPDKLSESIIDDVSVVENLEQIIADIKETVSLFDDFENKTLHNASNEHPTKILSDIHNDKIRKNKSTTTNSGHLANYELLDEVKEIRELNTDTVLSDLEHAIVDSKIDGTIDTLIPKIKQAILEAIVESAAFVPSHIPTGFPPSRQNVHYDANRYNMNDVEFINIDGEHNIKSSDVISLMKEKYSVPNQTTELNITESLNITDPKSNFPKNTLSDNLKLENKTESPDTIKTPPVKNNTPNSEKKGVTIDEVFESETLLNHPTSDVIINLKQNEKEDIGTEFDLTTTEDSLNNITDTMANEQSKDLEMSDILITELNSNYTNKSADFSTTATSINTTNYNKMPLLKILLESMINEKSHDSVKIKTVLNDSNTNNEINKALENNSDISDTLDSTSRYITSDQDNDADKDIINVANGTNVYKSEYVYEEGSFTDVVDVLTLKQDNITFIITLSDTLKSNNNSDTIIYHNENPSINTLELEEQTTLSHDGNDSKENNNSYIDQCGYISQSLLNSDLETRILYPDEKEIKPLDQTENAYIDQDFKDKITGSSWLESDNATTNMKLLPDTKKMSESFSHEIKSDFSLRDQPSLSDELSSDEFTDEIINAIIDILCIEDSECNNNTLHDTRMLTDNTSCETNDETKNNADSITILNEDTNIVHFTEDENISNDDFGSVLTYLDSTVNKATPANTIFNFFENVDNVSKERINTRGLLLNKMGVDSESSHDSQDKEIRGKAPEIASDKETEDEIKHLLENTKRTKEIYPNVSPNTDSNTVAIDVTKVDLKNTEEDADNEDDGFLDVPSVEKPPRENNAPENRITENESSNVETPDNDQNTAIDELLPDTGDVQVR